MYDKVYPIGTKFIVKRKNSTQERKIIDIYRTTNNNGVLVKIRYVTEHLFCGQVIVDSDVVAVTIAKGLANV